VVLVHLFLAAPAWAQDPGDEPLTFNYDRLLVTTFQADDERSEAEAVRLHQSLTERLAQNNELVPMSEVPEFDVHDYGPETYMRGCPPGRYSGCALVLGQRAKAQWVVGATVRWEADEFDRADGNTLLNVHFVDVTDAREVASFGVPLLGNEDTVLQGIVRVYDDIVKGAYKLEDLRDDTDPEAVAELDAARREILAQSLSELEGQLGTAVRAETVGIIEAPKLTKEDLAAYEDREDVAPWERLNMAQGDYLRFANSGKDIDRWRAEKQGRLGEIGIRVGGGFGGGPWSQDYQAQLLRSDTTLQPIHTVQFLEVINAGTATGEVELAFGVAPFLELGVLGGLHTGQTTLLKDEDVLDQVPIPSRPRTVSTTSYHFGARANLVPFPHWTARPTLALGVVSWRGSGIPEEDNYPRLDAPTMTLLQVLPGAEVSATRNVMLFLRPGAEIPLGGTTVRQTEEGAGLENPPAPTDAAGLGWIVHLGLQLRIGPLFRVSGSQPGTGAGIRFEDEDEDL
jgi:hypothetical protein